MHTRRFNASMSLVAEHVLNRIVSMGWRRARAWRDRLNFWIINTTDDVAQALQEAGPMRRRAGAALVVVSVHLLALVWLDHERVSPLQAPTFLVELSLGPGIGAYMEPRPTLRPAPVESDAEIEPKAAKPPPATDEETIETTAVEPISEIEPTEPVESVDPVTPSEPTDAVLALVEAITGTSRADIANTDVLAQVVSTPPGPALAVEPGGGCDIGGSLALRIGSDTVMRDVLASMPREALSVANAVQVWDGSWIESADKRAGPALAAVRLAILEAIEAAPADCRNQPLAGPRFVILPERQSSTTILVVGSGSWRWADLRERSRFAWAPWFGRRNR